MQQWMIEDTERAIYQAKANFLVAQGLFNYIEIIGAFLEPDENSSGEKFDVFFRRLGPEYKSLLRKFNGRRRRHPHIIYDDLRCGLSHEYAIKRKQFIVYGQNHNSPLSPQQINALHITINGIRTVCSSGVIHSWSGSKGTWHIINAKLWLDFRNALDLYWQQVNNSRNRELRRRFFRNARKINFLQFT